MSNKSNNQGRAYEYICLLTLQEVIGEKRPAQIKLTKEEFLNLVQNVGKQMRNANSVEKDIIARKLFLNLVIDKENKLTLICKPELDGLLSFDKVHSGGVFYRPDKDIWMASLTVKGKEYRKYFPTEQEAIDYRRLLETTYLKQRTGH